MIYCKKCNEIKKNNEFYFLKNGKVRYPCKKCRNKKTKNWRKNNPIRMKELNQKHRKLNRNKLLKYLVKYREKNKKKIVAYNKQYYKNNRERIKERRKYNRQQITKWNVKT